MAILSVFVSLKKMLLALLTLAILADKDFIARGKALNFIPSSYF